MKNRIQNYIAQHQLLNEGERITVALSGGADSVALLLVLKQLGYPLLAMHCNFHLRGAESDRDEAFVRDLCQSHQIELRVKHFQTAEYAQGHKISIEMAARQLRYDWFEEIRQETHCQAIAVAHHADDQAETLLLNMIRGTGLRGLCAMHPRQGYVVRPMLCVSRCDIIAFLEKNGQPYVTDSTNLERNTKRNVLRLDVLPLLRKLNPDVDRAFCQLTGIMQQSLPLFQRGVTDLFAENKVTESFPLHLLSHPSAQSLLYEWLEGKGFNHVQIKEMCNGKDCLAGRTWISPTHTVLRDRTAFFLKENDKSDECLPSINVEEVPAMGEFSDAWIYCDADTLQGELHLRHIQNGDRFTPFGMKGSRLISDFLTGLKMNRFQRESQLLLCAGDDIVWVVGKRADNRFRVTPRTQRIIRIWVGEK